MMMKCKLILSMFLLCLWASPSQATEQDCADSLKRRLPILTLNKNVEIRPGEKLSFGSVLTRGEEIPKLVDGTHVFILDQEQNLVISERYPDFDEHTPVVTHRSLYRKLEETLKSTPILIALGEIQVEHGVISFVSNKAGTAFLPDEYLPELAEVLLERGLPITPETNLIRHKLVKSGHQAEHVVAAYRSQVQSDPVLRDLQQKLIEFRSEVYQRFPSHTLPGTVDWQQYLQSSSGLENHFSLRTMEEHERMFFVAFTWLENMNDRYRTIPELLKTMSREQLTEVIHSLPRFEGTFYGM